MLKERGYTIEFPDYTSEEIGKIARAFLENKKYEIEESALALLLDLAKKRDEGRKIGF